MCKKSKNAGKPVLETGFPAVVLGTLNRCDSIVHCLFYRDPLFTKKTKQLRFYSVVHLQRSQICKKKKDCHSIMFCYSYSDPLLVDADGQARPGLVVVPPGLINNWRRELTRWASSLRVHIYHGQQCKLPEHMGDMNVLLTSHHGVRQDANKLQNARQALFSCMVIDEVQNIENHHAKVTKAVKAAGNAIGHTRIALSGTPVENGMLELHSIHDFSSTSVFQENANRSLEAARGL